MSEKLRSYYWKVGALVYWNFNTEGYITNPVESSDLTLETFRQIVADPYFTDLVEVNNQEKIKPLM
jgi:hypothetical protein